MASYATAGAETRVNTTVSRAQSEASIASLADGGWIVTWTSYGQDGSNTGIYMQRYAADGSAVGSETLVNTYTADAQFQSSVTGLADGGWVVSWASDGQDGSVYGAYQQLYSADGVAVGAETKIPTYTKWHQFEAVVTPLADGGWLTTWVSEAQDGDQSGVYQKRYDASGAAVTTETLVNTYTASHQMYPAVAALADGGWVTTWTSVGQDGGRFGVYQQRYDALGAAVGKETFVPSTHTGDKDLSAAAGLADGGWVVVWSNNATSFTRDIYLQRFSADGSTEGGETMVNTTVDDNQEYADIAALADGGWVVTWTSFGQDDDASGVYLQRYDANGAKLGGETQINVYEAREQNDTTITVLDDGSWVVAWTSYGQDGDDYGIYQRHFAIDVRGSAGADALTGTSWAEYLVGYSGNDTLDGKGGADVMIGGTGNDTYYVNTSSDQVQEFTRQGTDTVISSASYSLAALAAVENLTLSGSSNRSATGNGLANSLIGNSGANAINGGVGADILEGASGADTLTGGSGADSFLFRGGHSGNSTSTSDLITDFSRSAGDKFNLQAIDANTNKSDNQAFVFIGSEAYHKVAGELRFVKSDSGTTIDGDTNGDGKTDVMIRLDDAVSLKAEDFLL
ncbi:calcium-binding protein [Rhizobium sp. FKL33]|uniref:calcium-binding protein n=1 Tax=Rhizobium sp. FKL33 TaxID=2562307 RepID=UPI0010C005BB|nr:calcium-binding protein [Rhizobium sp. FKL33]